jgi:hypothetical protein
MREEWGPEHTGTGFSYCKGGCAWWQEGTGLDGLGVVELGLRSLMVWRVAEKEEPRSSAKGEEGGRG